MNLQPLYDVKERLEQAAIAGTGLLGEDFRLRRAAEALKPLAGASPVFGKIDAGLSKLLSAPAEARSGLLLDLLALVDAVAYTQAKTGADGELEPLPAGNGRYQELSYGQLQPLLAALTTTGGGRMETIQSAWDNHPEFFTDFRVLPALVAGLGDSYGDIADLNGRIARKAGLAAIPLLKEGFDPAGKKEMARRVEAIAAIEGAEATPWLREVLPQTRKDVRTAVIEALGADGENTALLLDLSKSERGNNRDAVLKALARLDGEAVQSFWAAETAKKPEHVEFLKDSKTEWASDLAASSLRALLEDALPKDGRLVLITPEGVSAFRNCRAAILGKSSPAMLDCWRWIDQHFDLLKTLKSDTGLHFRLGDELESWLLLSLCNAGPGPLAELCLELWAARRDQPRWLPHAVAAALMTRSSTEVYDEFAPYVSTSMPLLGRDQKKELSSAVIKGLTQVYWSQSLGRYLFRQGSCAPAQSLDPRWIERLVHAVWKPDTGRYFPFGGGDDVNGFDKDLVELADPNDPEQCAQIVPYLRARMVETGSWYSYSRYLLRFGGSPGGALGKAMKKSKDAYLYYMWQMLSEAAKVLPAGEVAGLCREALDSERFRPTGNELYLAKTVLPWTIEQLQAGKPFPEWAEWWSMRK